MELEVIMSKSIESEIKQAIIDELDLNISIKDIDDEEYLLTGGIGLDSIAMIEIFITLEEKFNIYFEDYDLLPENMVNIKTIAELVRNKKNV